MSAEAFDWFQLAIDRQPRHRPSRFDLAQLSPGDDSPAVALLPASAQSVASTAAPSLTPDGGQDRLQSPVRGYRRASGSPISI